MLDTAMSELREGIDFWISPARRSTETVGVTIVIPTFQAEATLSRALQSVHDQTLRDIEIIVADDGSTDSSWRQIIEWLPKEPRLRALRSTRNCGKSAIMNCATRFARGRWLAILDADDWYHCSRLAALMAIGDRSQADMVADNQFFYDAGIGGIVGTAWPNVGSDWKLTFDDYLVGSNAYDAFNFGMLKPLLRTDFVRSTRLSYDERARYGEDFFYLLQFFVLGGTAVISDVPYYFYTQPFGTLSHRWSHAERRRYDFQMVYDLNQGYLREDAEFLSPHQSRCLKARSRRLKSLENYFCARELLDRREWKGLLRQFVNHPLMLDCAIRRLFGRYFVRCDAPTAVRVADQSRRRSEQGVAEPTG
jgi:succinoglycan biosynthesis protein ExoO